jgi:3-oxoacyl-[acyl-carrier-protein] synthase-3
MAPRKDFGVGILGMGSSVPERILTNDDLAQMVDTSDEWIRSRTGIRQRHILSDGEAPSMITEAAARAAIADAGLTPADIDTVIVGTFTSDHKTPSTACLIQGRIGIPPCMSFDLNAACSSFVYSLQVAEGLMRTGVCQHPLVVGMDCASRYINYKDRDTCVLFGDGAGAVVLGKVEAGRGFLGQHHGAEGDKGENIMIPYGGAAKPLTAELMDSPDRFIRMNGREVYRFATRVLGEAVEKAMIDAGLQGVAIDCLVPHQANVRILESAAEKLKIPMDRIVTNMDRFGNTSAGSLPLALVTAREEGRLKPGSIVALVAFGSGLTYGAIVARW